MHPCSQDTANDHHTRQGAHSGTSHHGLSFKENTLAFFAAGFIQLLNLPPQHFSWKEKKTTVWQPLKKGSRTPPLWSSMFLPVVWRTAGVTGTVDYGMDCKTSVMFRGGGTGCSALHGNQMKALSVELNLHSKSPYGADYHTWEREQWGKIFCS